MTLHLTGCKYDPAHHRWACPICGRRFGDKLNMTKHAASAHRSSPIIPVHETLPPIEFTLTNFPDSDP